MKAPDEMFNSTASAEEGAVYQVPPDGIVFVDRDDVLSLLAMGFTFYREVDEQYDQGNLGGAGGVVDPGDLTVYFDNQLL